MGGEWKVACVGSRRGGSRRGCGSALVLVIAVAIAVGLVGVPEAPAQSRLSDRDVQALMANLKQDVKNFRPKFDAAIKKSSIRKTSQERDAKNLVANFEKQTETMLGNFKKTRKGDDVQTVLSSANQIDKLVSGLKLDSPTTSSWGTIQGTLGQLAGAFGMTWPVTKTAAASQGTNTSTCADVVGVERAKRMADECMQVSPATHPPCNVQNSCVMIIDEIKRGCAMVGKDAPAFCRDYQ